MTKPDPGWDLDDTINKCFPDAPEEVRQAVIDHIDNVIIWDKVTDAQLTERMNHICGD